MPDEIKKLIQFYRRRGAILDSNLLLLLLVGLLDESLVPNFKRTRNYSVEDFHTLRRAISLFKKICTTPNILTEVTNLGKFDGKYKQKFADLMAKNILSMEEHYIESKVVIGSLEFLRFGLTDTINMTVAAKGFLLLTNDAPLASHCREVGIAVININHLKQLNMGIQ